MHLVMKQPYTTDVFHFDDHVTMLPLHWLEHLASRMSLNHSLPQRKNNTIHQLTTILSTSKNVLFAGHNQLLITKNVSFPGHNQLQNTSADDPTL